MGTDHTSVLKALALSKVFIRPQNGNRGTLGFTVSNNLPEYGPQVWEHFQATKEGMSTEHGLHSQPWAKVFIRPLNNHFLSPGCKLGTFVASW